MKTLKVGVLSAAIACWAVPAMSQSRPLVTEDPETVPAGFILFEAAWTSPRMPASP